MDQFVNEFLKYFLSNPLVIIFFIIAILCAVFYKQIVGKAGEHHVKVELRKLPKDKYLVINDLMIKANGSTHQIDHVIISNNGIFVIETKQYNGYIVGNEYDKKWRQNNKYYINNPIHQNYGHIKALEELLKLSEDKFIPIVCIPSNARLKIDSKSLVLQLYDLIPKIKEFNEVLIDNPNDIYRQLLESNITDKESRKQHNKYASNIKTTKEINDKNKCPKCGGDLVERNGKYGKFIGCSNYPKCKYTRK